ncbi:FAD-dependent oxidoreductase [Hoeflea sp.]|uniref:FAD-dependent oxidoreductase n=1 Tax=Hoeflea sp. TaxID=1940281 RepID=UPI002AFFA678|nr:FAD-dependent oxidoreductase [Hoeflea sp.]
MIEESCTVVIVGGGTAGLALAAELQRLDVGKVVVLEREAEAGGIPRHCGHYPFGVGEYGRLLKGPDYARRNRDLAASLGADIRTGTTVTALRPGGVVEIMSNAGRTSLHAQRVVLCTGVRESSRAQRFVSGDRPGGVLTTGALQSMVYLKGIKPFTRPVIFGSELVSFSAIQTCEHLGIKPVAMVEEADRIRARRLLRPYLLLKRVPLYSAVRNLRILGRERVEALEFADANGDTRQIETDGIIMSGHFRPESALLRSSHIEVDPGSGGPVIDQFGRCSDPTYFSTGNLLRAAETSDFCWREATETARRLSVDLERPAHPQRPGVAVVASDPAIGFIVPQRLVLEGATGGMTEFYLGLTKPVDGTIIARCGNRTLWKGKLKSRPIRRIHLPIAGVLAAAPDTDIRFSMEGDH